MKVVAVTACPTGIAHTYMAQETIELACKKRGYEYKVETQGGMGIENELTANDIASADVVLLAVSIVIEGEERFAGKPIVRVKVDRAIKDIENLLDEVKNKGEEQ